MISTSSVEFRVWFLAESSINLEHRLRLQPSLTTLQTIGQHSALQSTEYDRYRSLHCRLQDDACRVDSTERSIINIHSSALLTQ